MSDIFDNLSDKIKNISNRIVQDGKKIILSAFSKGEEMGHQGKIKFEIDNGVLISKVIDGRFPDYTKVIPKNNCGQ